VTHNGKLIISHQVFFTYTENCSEKITNGAIENAIAATRTLEIAIT